MITGRTRVIAVVGDPISAARAPQALNAAVAASGADLVTVPAEVAADQLAAFVSAARGWSNLGGLVVTMPHKAAIVAFIDGMSERARITGTVNVVRRTHEGTLFGDQIDGEGFVGSLHRAGIGIVGTRIALLGAGGVARAIAFSLMGGSPARLRIMNRSAERARELVHDLTAAYPAFDVAVGTTDDVATANLVINATSVGSSINPGLPIRPELLAPGAMVADVVAKPERTALLHEAERRGLRTHNGVLMQEAQIDRILALLR